MPWAWLGPLHPVRVGIREKVHHHHHWLPIEFFPLSLFRAWRERLCRNGQKSDTKANLSWVAGALDRRSFLYLKRPLSIPARAFSPLSVPPAGFLFLFAFCAFFAFFAPPFRPFLPQSQGLRAGRSLSRAVIVGRPFLAIINRARPSILGRKSPLIQYQRSRQLTFP